MSPGASSSIGLATGLGGPLPLPFLVGACTVTPAPTLSPSRSTQPSGCHTCAKSELLGEREKMGKQIFTFCEQARFESTEAIVPDTDTEPREAPLPSQLSEVFNCFFPQPSKAIA